ncbi:MAG: thioether cross-link-forming SCIFF peptide maturase [Tepidanaerobacter acetatoxydans]|uniref:thioether cross-link-forming SCIFF peptide maturase n=1 Tax=Tepidanaerobacter TaxID=499228 RepID=UPI000AD2F40E|nr:MULTISPECIES: thioether cross-link-forming SCIFF peptide maturase [Tepidanaerobacter]NLU10566.1 thioether cross-link-forming SCIFF peptide maturase [Tepidanaerobacter acetatoxydans]
MTAQIHKFRVFDKNLVLDVNSGSVLQLDDLAYDILDYYDECSLVTESALNELEMKYPKQNIKEALEEIETLKKEGYLFTETNLDPILNRLDTRHYVKALCLNVAHDCNLRCKYCFASKGDYHGKRELMSIEVGKKAVDFLVEKSGNMKNLEIDFFGGEPLMAMDTVREVISYAKSIEELCHKKFHFTITTNALLLNDEVIQYLHEHMDNIVLSLDGRKKVNDFIRVRADGSGTYDEIVSNIKKIVELRKRDKKEYYVRGTFTKYNLDFAEDVFHMADLGFKEISIEPVVGKDGDYLLEQDNLEILFKQYEKIANEYLKRKESVRNPFKFYHFNVDIYHGPCIYKRLWACGAGRDYLAITPSGDIYPCHQFIGQEKFIMGNVFEGELDENIIAKMRDTHVFSKPKCTTCWARYFCSGGCNANNFIINGDMKKPYEIACELQKKRIEYAIYLNVVNE